MSVSQVRSMILNVLIYSVLEVLSLMALHFIVKKKFGFSPVYILGFVLESQTIELQARLVVWFVFIPQLTLIHFGTAFVYLARVMRLF